MSVLSQPQTRLQRRRKTALEMAGQVVPISVAVLSSGILLAEWSVATASLSAVFAGVLVAAYWSWHRGRYPATIDSPSPEQPRQRVERDEDAGSVWHPINLLVLLIGAIAVASVVLVGMVAALALPLLVILGFGFADGWSDGGAVVKATLCTAAAGLAVEFGLVIPLCKRWGLATDSPARRREDFCPSPESERL